MQLDYVDLLFCHRPDTTTPIEETVRAMNYIIDHGWAFYWCALFRRPCAQISLLPEQQTHLFSPSRGNNAACQCCCLTVALFRALWGMGCVSLLSSC